MVTVSGIFQQHLLLSEHGPKDDLGLCSTANKHFGIVWARMIQKKYNPVVFCSKEAN